MKEGADNSVDLIIFAPPYNIDTPYSDEKGYDSKTFESFKKMMSQIIGECTRTMKPEGLLLNESADTIYSREKLIALSGLIQKLGLDNGLKMKARHINFMHSKDGVELLDFEHNWSEDYYCTEDAHSNCHQWIVMCKYPDTKFNKDGGKVFYVDYPKDEEGHPCPFSAEHVRIFLDILGFKPGMTVLEPFMGTGRLGREVIKRGGKYIGYELVAKHFETAKSFLEKAI